MFICDSKKSKEQAMHYECMNVLPEKVKAFIGVYDKFPFCCPRAPSNSKRENPA
jgi:hypothetical protein